MTSPNSSTGSFDSLFDEDEESKSPSKISCEVRQVGREINAGRTTPPIPGLYIFPELLGSDISQTVLQAIIDSDIFVGGKRNQVMLFASSTTPLPLYLTTLLSRLKNILRPFVPSSDLSILFDQPLNRQVILNLYPPGQGISPHIDLPNRYADGIIGISLSGGTVITLQQPQKEKRHDVYIPSRSVYLLTREARWEWEHGIEGRLEDLVKGTTIFRETRVSVTFRWMKEGGDVLS